MQIYLPIAEMSVNVFVLVGIESLTPNQRQLATWFDQSCPRLDASLHVPRHRSPLPGPPAPVDERLSASLPRHVRVPQSRRALAILWLTRISHTT